MKKEMGEDDSHEDREGLRNAIMLVYSGGNYGRVEAELWGWDHNFVHMLVNNSMPLGLDDNSETKSLVRAASRAAGCDIPDRCWTDTEARSCIFEGLQPAGERTSGLRTAADLRRHFGLGKTTFFRFQKALLQEHPDIEVKNKAYQRAAIASIPLPRGGRQSYFSPDEMKVIFTTAVAFQTVGEGWSATVMRAKCRDMIRSSAVQLANGDPDRLELLSNAVCSRTWLTQQLNLYGPDAGVAPKTAKTSKKSRKRAEVRSLTRQSSSTQPHCAILCTCQRTDSDVSRFQANNPMLTEAMFDKFENVFEELHRQGFLRGPRPEAHQCHNMDEIGVDSTAKWDSVFRFEWNDQRYTIGTGEKAPFWTTIVVTTCANGQFPMPPVIIHQGKEGQLSEHLMLCASLVDPDGEASMENSNYLPGNWIVYQVRFPRIFYASAGA